MKRWIALVTIIVVTFGIMLAAGTPRYRWANPIVPAKKGDIILPPLPADLDVVISATHDPTIGGQVAYYDKNDQPRLKQYSFIYEGGECIYRAEFNFVFWNGRKTPKPNLPGENILLPPLPRDCVEVLSITNNRRIGIVVGYTDRDNKLRMVQYSYSNRVTEIIYDKMYNYRFKETRRSHN